MKKSMRKLLISSLTLAMLLVNSLNVFVMAICGAAIVTVIFRKRFTRR